MFEFASGAVLTSLEGPAGPFWKKLGTKTWFVGGRLRFAKSI